MESKQVSAAFVKAQKAFAPMLKESINPHLKSKYVNLAGCIDAVIDALNNNGLALMQKTIPWEHGASVETLFIHESGEVLSGGIFNAPSVKMDAQGFGSALTYARRYGLMAACGQAPEDDDGHSASTKQHNNKVADKVAEKVVTKTKLPISNDRLFNAIEKIKAGEYTLDALNKNFLLTDEQKEAVLSGLGGSDAAN